MHMASGGLVFFAILMYFVIRAIANSSQPEYRRPPAAEPPPDRETEPRRRLPPPRPPYRFPPALPRKTRIAAWWRRSFRARDAIDGEWLLDFDEPDTYRITMPMPRRLVRAEVTFADARLVPLEEIVVNGPDGEEVTWTGRWRIRDSTARLRLEFAGTAPVTEVRMRTGLREAEDCNTKLRFVPAGEPDAPPLKAAMNALRLGNSVGFRRKLEEYEEHCRSNPVTALHLAHLCLIEEQDELAERHALRALGLNRIAPSLEILRRLAQRRSWQLEAERLRMLRDDLAAWSLEGHHGLVVLLQERDYTVGPGGYVRERFHAAYLVRRKAAARKFRSLAVPFVAGAGGLINTEAQVRRADGTVETLHDDRFTVGSAQDDNPFVAVARKRTGIWILNDLAPGDVVEYTWDMVRLGKNSDGHHDLFMLANIADTDTPTLHAQVSFTAPGDWDLSFAVRNTHSGRESELDIGTQWRTTVFARERIVPRRSHSLPYQETRLHPLVGCALAGPDWSEVGRSVLLASRDSVAATTAVPGPLAEACAGDGGPREVLSRAFYWIRDRVKYASIASSNRDLGGPDRAERIVAAGVGDCKDTSLLLAVVCRHHDIPWEFVLMSVEHGIVLEELPADQFDHMLVRARIDDEWLYLDAAGDATLFGSPPFPFQGVTVLTGADGGTLVPLSEIPLERTRVEIHETIDAIEGGRLLGSVDLRLEGHPARMIDEVWKHHSLVSVDPERAADDAVRHLISDCEIADIDRRSETATSDVLHVVLRSRRGRLVALDGHRIAALSFGAPALPALARRPQRYQEMYAFLMRGEFVYRLELKGAARRLLRGISAVAGISTPFCSVSETRLHGEDMAGIVRRIRITDRLVAGADLSILPAALERIEEATHVVVSLSGEEMATGA